MTDKETEPIHEVYQLPASSLRSGDLLIEPADRNGVARTCSVTAVEHTISGRIMIHTPDHVLVTGPDVRLFVVRRLTVDERKQIGAKGRPAWMT